VSLVFFVVGTGLLIVGAELLVRGASRLARGVGISPLVVGLTVVAYGTSAPELAVSVRSALAGQADLALGNVVGSNIFNVLFILGLSAIVTPLVVPQQIVRLDVPIMIGVTLLTMVFALDGRLSVVESAVLLAGAVGYTVFLIRASKSESAAVADEYAAEFSGAASGRSDILAQIGLVVAGLALLVLGARWLVDAAIAMARAVGVSELVIGLTIVAAGTSMPEVATSVLAAFRGERDIAVGNVVGSNIFNVLAVLGLSGMAGGGIDVAPAVLSFDLPVALAVAVACLPITFSGHRIARWEGLLFLTYYVAYTTYVVLAASANDALPAFGAAMAWFVLPLTVVTVLIVAWREGVGASPEGS